MKTRINPQVILYHLQARPRRVETLARDLDRPPRELWPMLARMTENDLVYTDKHGVYHATKEDK